MKSIYPSILVYAFASVLTIISTVLKCDSLTFFVKPVIVPAIFYYYIQKNGFKIDWLFFLGISSSYASDMIVLLEHRDDQVIITLLNLLTYVVMLYYVIHDLRFKKMGMQKIIYFVGNLLSFLGIVYIMLSLMSDITTISLALYVVYGVVISLLTSLAIINHLVNHNLKTFYGLLMCICFVTTDVFYVVYNFYMGMIVFLLLNLAAQFLSYFYMMKYMTVFPKSEIEYGK
ncbi:hypothetical protein NAT51_08725 [Flavobacterium amniphilum]|uniref:hypothetical protein n=1 Tax=Flavobacterium amniphilum TaxID=1834035 RepID=UPI00202A9D0C|nr:hypothetical protein [Flavobacterium amniphilum]MCL9805604.1 hypothetical protein [Flavobacterium amniphilum]